MIDGKPSTKARLCANFYQDLRTDSPTCSNSLHTVLAIIASLKWDLCSIDIQTAFLQGTQIDRLVYICLPREANSLADAPRHFCLQLHHELVTLGVTPSPLDQGRLCFWFHKDELSGILICHVNAILLDVNPNFLPSVILERP